MATLPKITFDSNSLIDIENKEGEFSSLLKICDLARNGKIELQVVGISASENGKNGFQASNFSEFVERLNKLQLDFVTILKPTAIFDLTFFDWSIFPSDEILQQQKEIHQILFSNIDYDYLLFCQRDGVDINLPFINKKWRNARCDSLALWSHIYSHGDVFVTRDTNFHKKTKKEKLELLGAGKILNPKDVLGTLNL